MWPPATASPPAPRVAASPSKVAAADVAPADVAPSVGHQAAIATTAKAAVATTDTLALTTLATAPATTGIALPTPAFPLTTAAPATVAVAAVPVPDRLTACASVVRVRQRLGHVLNARKLDRLLRRKRHDQP